MVCLGNSLLQKEIPARVSQSSVSGSDSPVGRVDGKVVSSLSTTGNKCVPNCRNLGVECPCVAESRVLAQWSGFGVLGFLEHKYRRVVGTRDVVTGGSVITTPID